MSNSKQIIDALINEDLYTAKKLINEDLVNRMGNALEEKLINFGPTLYEGELKGNQKKIDANNNGKIDADDFKILKKRKTHEDVESVENIIAENFEAELQSLVEEIEQETGEELTEEEIIDIANMLLDMISEEEEKEEEEEDEDEEEEDESNISTQKGPKSGPTIGGQTY